MTTVLTMADVTKERPPLGSVVRVVPWGELAVFAKHPGTNLSCSDCAFVLSSPDCKSVQCFGGVYIPKNKYLEMRLLGEL